VLRRSCVDYRVEIAAAKNRASYQSAPELWKGSIRKATNVRFGSKADICTAIGHVRFNPESGAIVKRLSMPMVSMSYPSDGSSYGARPPLEPREADGYAAAQM